ncbi:MAG: type II secretion system F family protein [Kiritimatiellia bacterium]
MPRYRYRAKQGPGQTVEREMAAESRAAVLSVIEAKGLTPVWVKVVEGKVGHRRKVGRIRAADITIFTRQLASMIRGGVPVMQAMHSIQEQTESGGLRSVLEEIEAGIRDGAMLSEALKVYPQWFSPLYVSMVEAGEAAGVLDTILERLADAREREDESRRQVQAAMAYPVLVGVVGLLTVIILLTFFMPRVMRLFDQSATLPMATRILLAVSGFMTQQGHWLLLTVALVLVVLRRLAAMHTGRIFMDTLFLRLPLLGHFLRDVALARFARTFGLLVRAGIPIERVLLLSGKTLSNAVLQQDVEALRVRTVQQGMRLSSGLRQSIWFPAFFSNMVSVGEETGHLDESLDDIARYYEAAVARQGRIATALIEPLLLLFVGGIVGFIVFAMLMPIFELGGQLR